MNVAPLSIDDLAPLSWISAEEAVLRDVCRYKELIDCGGGWFTLACPWCRHETEEFELFDDVYDVCDGEKYAILTCPECGREYVVKETDAGYRACAIMSAADLRYLRWREARGLRGSYWELTP